MATMLFIVAFYLLFMFDGKHGNQVVYWENSDKLS
jgi:hypothetical protein